VLRIKNLKKVKDKNYDTFISVFSESFENNIISKITISFKNKISTERRVNSDSLEKNINSEISNKSENIVKNINIEYSEIKTVFVKPIKVKDQVKLSFLFRYPTKDITQNYTFAEAKAIFDQIVGVYFLQVDMFLITESVHLLIDKKGKTKFNKRPLTDVRQVDLAHNKTKNTILTEGQSNFLSLLGVFTAEGRLKNDKRDKFKQINKYLEFFAQALKESLLTENFSVVDMGSGKGYLTFAMYDYITNILHKKADVVGVEYRQDMVDLCNGLAAKAGFGGLRFEQGTIEKSQVSAYNILIALHACDTATDDAIFMGIKQGAEVIMVSPCCHKQVRKSLKMEGVLSPFARFGIIEERQAEILTDTIRIMALEASGYKAKIFEFIDSEHTPKNLMITAVKQQGDYQIQTAWGDIHTLMKQFGLSAHRLLQLLEK
jgi:SAM-dependent methyltransferase